MKSPNILIFQAEDTGRHQGCYGDPFAQTPCLDRLASDGCRFTNAISTAGVCAPSRCTMVTGRYPTELGNHNMRSSLCHPPKLMTEVLREAGYFVNWANKTDFNLVPPDSFADARTSWIDELENGNVPEQPFFLYYNFHPTHESFLWPPEAKQQVGEPLPEPGYKSEGHDGVPVPPYLPDTPVTRSGLLRYYDQLSCQDHFIGRVMNMLRLHDLEEDTIVIYLSDHGRGLPREKPCLYEAGIHLPLIIRWPGRIPAGSVREDLVSWIDLAPTLLHLAGIDRSMVREELEMPGRVFLTGGDGEVEPEAPCAFAACDRQGDGFDRMRAARDRRYLYLRNDFPNIPYAQRNWYRETSPVLRQMREKAASGELAPLPSLFMVDTKPAEELYDTLSDPHCVFNLIDDPRFAGPRDRLSRELDAWRGRYDIRGQMDEEDLIADGVIDDALTVLSECEGFLPESLRRGGHFDTRTRRRDPGVAK